MSADVSSRPLTGGRFCHFTPDRSLNVHTRLSELDDQDSARSPLSVRSLGLVASSENGWRTRRLLVSPTNWNVPTDCVIRGSMTGGSHPDARARVPPRFAGFVLAEIQSGNAAAALTRVGRAPIASAV